MNYKVIRSGGHIESLFVDETAKLGRGATANVYRVHFDGKDLAAKIYHQGRLFNKDKIRAMLENPPDDREVISHGQEYPQFAWPLFIIWDKTGNEVGFLMPLVDTHESFTLDHYYDLGLFKKLNSHDEAALSYKLEIAKNLSRLVADLHSHGHFFIDCKPQNIRVFKRNHVVTLIDCDGFSIMGKHKRFPAELLSTDYIAPEAQRNNTLPSDLGELQDRYALAVILFQLLNRGTHPFQGLLTDNSLSFNTNDEKAAAGLYPYGIVPNPRIKPRPQSTHHLWCEETRIFFDQAFANGSPAARPLAREWADHFESLLTTKSIVRCEKHPNDVSHMRFRNMRCSACYLKALPLFIPPQRMPEQPPPEPSPAPKLPQTLYKLPPSLNSSPNANWWLLVFVLLLGLAFWAVKPNDAPKPSTTVAQDKYISLYVSTRDKAVGYSVGYDTQAKADSVALISCEKQKGDNLQDKCVKILSGPGKCLGISRSENLAIGAVIQSTRLSAATDAQLDCIKMGGKDCSFDPQEYSFCDEEHRPLDSLIERSPQIRPVGEAFVVQAKSFDLAAEAQAHTSKLVAAGLGNAFVDGPVDADGRAKYRVRVGPFSTREAAQAVQIRLRTLGYEGAFINSMAVPTQASSESVQGYGTQIRSCVQRGVSFPLPPRGGAGNPSVQYRVSLTPAGQIADVRLTDSSGNVNFDRAVETGIRRCTPFPKPLSVNYPGYIDINYRMYD
jgi:TonB family protein